VRWHWYFSALALAGGAFVAAYASYVWRRRRASAGASLAVVLAAAGWWGLAYAIELGASQLSTKLFWGDAKWLGIALLPPAWFVFIMQYTGRSRWLNRYTLAALVVPAVAVIVLLAVRSTHDLVRYYEPGAAGDPDAIAQVGPLFWPFLIYANLVVWGATAVFVWTLMHVSRLYWRQSVLLIVTVLLPSVANVVHNLNLGPFGRVEPTPFLFVLTGTVLVWGIFRFHLLDLAPIARSSVLETIQDGVVVLDPLGRLVSRQERERRQLATSLRHVDPRLRGAASSLDRLRAGLDRPDQLELVEGLRGAITESLGRLRQLAFELRPPPLDRIGLAAALGQYAKTVGEQAGFRVHLEDHLDSTLPAAQREIAYRIAQEALANVAAHAGAQRVTIWLDEADEGGMRMRISDDGAGFLPGIGHAQPGPDHLGMVSMREQAAMAGGWCRVASSPGMGTTVELWLPLPADR
jgi:signal transduction histidine kinase